MTLLEQIAAAIRDPEKTYVMMFTSDEIQAARRVAEAVAQALDAEAVDQRRVAAPQGPRRLRARIPLMAHPRLYQIDRPKIVFKNGRWRFVPATTPGARRRERNVKALQFISRLNRQRP